MPVKHIRIHTHDAPWVTKQFKNLIKLRQLAFQQEHKESYQHPNEANPWAQITP